MNSYIDPKPKRPIMQFSNSLIPSLTDSVLRRRRCHQVHWSRVGFHKAGSEGKAKKRLELMVSGKAMLGEIAWQWQMVVDGCQVPPPSFSFPTAIYPRCPASFFRIKAYVYLDWACLATTIHLNYWSHCHLLLCSNSRQACQIRSMYRQCLSRTSPAATGYPHTTISLNSTAPT